VVARLTSDGLSKLERLHALYSVVKDLQRAKEAPASDRSKRC